MVLANGIAWKFILLKVCILVHTVGKFLMPFFNWLVEKAINHHVDSSYFRIFGIYLWKAGLCIPDSLTEYGKPAVNP